jgi:CheY-like chemotaxis protein
MDLYLESFDVCELIRNIKEVVKPLVDRKGNRLEIFCGEEVGKMTADLTKVRQSLFNLLSNAAKFTENGSIVLKVSKEADDWIRFEVKDTGIGMEPAQIEHLFQSFTQADPSTTRKYGGTGLGLSITKHFCEMMGGSIEVQSQPSVGTTFIIRLPVNVQLTLSNKEEKKGSDEEISIKSDENTSLGDVLIIEDDKVTMELMKRVLEKEGFRVYLAANGKEGINLARQIHPDVITLDVMMPDLDGWSVLTLLKSDAELAEIPIIMVTIVDDRSTGYALGASDYLVKPVDRERLITAIKPMSLLVISMMRRCLL